ncbi:MAG: hypothetical protein ACOC2C_00625 [Cyclonatronaceae bacterium]
MSEPLLPLKIDLLRGSEKSGFRMALGVLFFIIAAGWILYKVLLNEPLHFFDAALFLVFILNAAFQLAEGSGLSLAALFGTAFIIIDKEAIVVKPSVRTKEQRISWEAITQIDLSGENPRLRLDESDEGASAQEYRLDLSMIAPGVKTRVRETISALARQKNIVLY